MLGGINNNLANLFNNNIFLILIKISLIYYIVFVSFKLNNELVVLFDNYVVKLLCIILIFYTGAIFWTLAYDTIYGFQDIKDDEIIGLKSTSIKFKNKPYFFLFLCYSIFLLSLYIVGYLMDLNKIFLIFFFLIFIQMYYFQLKKLQLNNPNSCLNVFKSNNILGALVFLGLILGKI